MNAATTSHVLFRAGGLPLAAPANAVQAIHDELTIQPIEGTQPWFLGLAVARGRLLPVSDLGAFFNQTPSAGHTLQVNPTIGIAGLRVDNVLGITEDSPVRQPIASRAPGNAAMSAWKISRDATDHRVVDIAMLLQLPRFLNISERAD